MSADSDPTDRSQAGPSGSARAGGLAGLNRIMAAARRPFKSTRQPASQWSNARDPILLGQLVDELVTEAGWQQQLSVADLVVRWADMVGQVAALHCQPSSYVDGELTIQADSSAWASAIRLELPAIQAKIEAEVGVGLVSLIKVRGPAGPPGAKGRWRVKSPK